MGPFLRSSSESATVRTLQCSGDNFCVSLEGPSAGETAPLQRRSQVSPAERQISAPIRKFGCKIGIACLACPRRSSSLASDSRRRDIYTPLYIQYASIRFTRRRADYLCRSLSYAAAPVSYYRVADFHTRDAPFILGESFRVATFSRIVAPSFTSTLQSEILDVALSVGRPRKRGKDSGRRGSLPRESAGSQHIVGPEETIMHSSTWCIRWGQGCIVILVSLVSFISSPPPARAGTRASSVR